MLRNGLKIALLLGLIVGIPACAKKKSPAEINYAQELPPGQMALRKISPSEYPDFSPAFSNANLPAVSQAITQSLDYLSRPSSRQFYPYLDIDHARAVATLKTLQGIIDRELQATYRSTPDQINREIAEKFEVYKSIGAPRPDGPGYTEQVLFTGYYTPIFEASLERQGPYQYPLYRRPDDLVSDPVTGEVHGRRMPDGSIQPYPTRQEIEQSGMLAGQEIVWLKDRFDAYIIHVQGSARLRLPNGQIWEIGYAGNNGYAPVSIAMQLVEDGAIPREQLNLTAVRNYFRQNPQALDRYIPMNPRFVFFTERSGGPYGSLNVPVTPYATIATDKSVYPRAMPAFLQVPVPVNTSGMTSLFRGFMLDQDTGGAIRAAGRCDIYMGIGEEAERIAGYQLHAGELYYLAVKPEYVMNGE